MAESALAAASNPTGEAATETDETKNDETTEGTVEPDASAATEDTEGSGKDTDAEGGDDPDKGKDDDEDGAPKEYEPFTMPEGVDIDQEATDRFIPVAKELGLTQEQAQKLVDLAVADRAAAMKAVADNWNAQNEEWAKAAAADKEIGGNDHDEKVAIAARAIDTFGTPALKEALDTTGAGNHPEFVRFCYRVGKLISEDGHIVPGASPMTDLSDGEVFYPNQGKDKE